MPTDFNYLGIVAAQATEHKIAIEYFEKAIKVSNKNYIAYTNLGKVLLDLRRFEEALQATESALHLQPKDPIALNNRGIILMKLGRFQEAKVTFENLAKIDPENPEHWNNLASILIFSFQFQEAIQIYKQNIIRHPKYFETRANLGMLYLRLGDFENGFKEYEYRKKNEFDIRQKKLSTPRWQGEQLKGKTLLVLEEQGFGDTFQFLRYVPLLKRYDCRVLLLFRFCLHPLLSDLTLPLISEFDSIPKHDLHVNLLSLPSIFQTNISTIPPPFPYKKCSQKKNRIGIIWKGSPKNRYDWSRSIDLKILIPLLEHREIEFISLQKEITQEEDRILDRYQVKKPPINTWENTLDAIRQCEKIISIESSVAHLSASAGITTWILLPSISDWRWMLERKDSPWYPTVKLFRQKKFGDWSQPIDDLDLRQFF